MSRDHYGPSAREQAVLDLWEANRSIDEIATELDLDRLYVRRIVSMLAAPKADDWHGAARMGSKNLLRALRRHHPERCRGAA